MISARVIIPRGNHGYFLPERQLLAPIGRTPRGVSGYVLPGARADCHPGGERPTNFARLGPEDV